MKYMRTCHYGVLALWLGILAFCAIAWRAVARIVEAILR